MKFSLKRSSRKLAVGLSMLLFAMMAVVASAQIENGDGWAKSWIDGIGEILQHDYTRYSQEDVAAAQARLQLIDADLRRAQDDEWAGVYVIDCPDDVCSVMDEKLRWSSRAGFIHYYVYTCLPTLRYLNFGSASPLRHAVSMTPEYPVNSGRRHEPVRQYVKAQWGQRHYLIQEDKLEDFCDSAAGLKVRSEDEAISIEPFWVKSDDLKKPISGLPVLPPGYELFSKQPIETIITAVGPNRIQKDYIDAGTTWHRSVSLTPVTLRAGAAEGVKINTIFRALRSNETVRIKQVDEHTSTGVIVRDADAIDDERSFDSETGGSKSSPKIKVGWRLTTRPERLDQ